MAAASMRLTKSALALLRPSISRARSLSTLASSPPLLADSRAKRPLLDNAVRFNFSTVSLSRHCHSSSASLPDEFFTKRCFTRDYDRIDDLEFTAMELEPIVYLLIHAGRKRKVVETENFLKVLVEEKNGLAGRIFSKAGLDKSSILEAIDDFISKEQPKVVRDPTLMLGEHVYSLLENSIEQKKDMEDEIVSVEHFLLAFCLDRRFGQQLFANLGLSEKALRDAIDAVRGSKKRELNEHWGVEKELMNRIQTLKEEIDRIDVEMEAGTLISFRRQLEEAEKHLAEIERKWTGTHFEDALHQGVVGQNMAVVSVADAIRRSRAGLSDPNRPVASFVFMGSTCVGKKTLVKTLADYLFNAEGTLSEDLYNTVVRAVDMSEDMGEHAASRLVVALHPGRKDEELVQLAEFVRHRPYCAILFEEIEKAHPDVLSILLQVLENGRITDCEGRTVCFKNTVVIMTSKIGSHLIQETLSNTQDTQEVIYDIMKKQVVDLARETFCSELMNCIDEYVVFKPLDASEMRSLAEKDMSGLKEMFKQEKVECHYTEEAINLVARLFYDPNSVETVVKEGFTHRFGIAMANLWVKSKYRDVDPEMKVDEIKVDVIKLDVNSDLGLGEVRGEVFPTHYRVHLGTNETGIRRDVHNTRRLRTYEEF